MKSLTKLTTITFALLVLAACSGRDESAQNSGSKSENPASPASTSVFTKSIESDLPRHVQDPMKQSNLTRKDLGDLKVWRSYYRPAGVEMFYSPSRIRISNDDRIAMDFTFEKTGADAFIRCGLTLVTAVKTSKNSDGSEQLSLDLETAEFMYEIGVNQAAANVTKEECFQKMTLQQLSDALSEQKSKAGIDLFKILSRSNETVVFAGLGADSYEFKRDKPDLLEKQKQGCNEPNAGCLP